MSTYIRGPVCGVDNCRSRLWRMIDGRRICQYGHVMEGDVEFNDDEDDVNAMGVVTRRLNLTTGVTGNFQSSLNLSQSQRSVAELNNRIEKVYGRDGKKLFLKAFQYVLRKQCKWLKETLNFPESFEVVVKLIWILYLKQLDIEVFKNGTGRDGEGEAEEEEEEEGHEQEEEEEEAPKSRRRRNTKNRLGLSMVSSLSIIYLASLHTGLPVFADDLVRWVCVDNFPYFRSHHMLPEEWFKRLPNYYLQILDAGKPPHEGQIYHKTAHLAEIIGFKSKFNNKIQAPVLLFKLCLLEGLPGEFYVYCKEFLKSIDVSLEMELLTYLDDYFRKPYQYPEIRICAALIATVKLKLLGSDSMEAGVYGPKFAAAWLKAIKETEKVNKNSFWFANHILRMSYTPSMSILGQDMDSWTDDTTNKYLDWIQKNILVPEEAFYDTNKSIDEKIANRKLHNLIPLTLPNKSKKSPQNSNSLTDDLYELFSNINKYWKEMEVSDTSNIELMTDRLTESISLRFAISYSQLQEAVSYLLQKYTSTQKR